MDSGSGFSLAWKNFFQGNKGKNSSGIMATDTTVLLRMQRDFPIYSGENVSEVEFYIEWKILYAPTGKVMGRNSFPF